MNMHYYSLYMWMYEYQLGITGGYLNAQAGYQRFIFQSAADSDYLSLSESYDSNYGTIKSSYTADGKGNITNYKAAVPANTKTTLYLPVSDGNTDFDATPGARFVRKTIHFSIPVAEYELTSSTFEFTIRDKRISVI